MSKIKCVLFDIGGVLVDWHMSWITGEVSDRFKIAKSSIDDAFAKYLGELDCGKIVESDFWNKVGVHCSSVQLQNTGESLWNTYFRKNAIQNDTLIEMSQSIKEKNFTIGVLSNIEKVTHCIVEDWNVLKHFDYRFFSYEIGYSKPDSKIYQHVIENMPFEFHEVLFIDDKQSNIEGAQKMGINGIHFSDNESLKKSLVDFDIMV